jgi:hypothetical protein
MAMSLSARTQASHGNGGRVFLIFVADPITVRLLMTELALDSLATVERLEARVER